LRRATAAKPVMNMMRMAGSTATARQFDAVHLRHHDIRQQQIKAPLGQYRQGLVALTHGKHFMTRPFQGAAQEMPHGIIVFRQQDLRHFPTSIPMLPATGDMPLTGAATDFSVR